MNILVIEHIAENIEEIINAITEANGFHYDLTAVRPRRIDFDTDNAPGDRKSLLVQAEEVAVEAKAIGTEEWMQAFIIMTIVTQSDFAADSIDTKINKIRADIERKLKEDNTRGGYALDTLMDESVIFNDARGWTGVAMKIWVKYRTKYDDPYTKA